MKYENLIHDLILEQLKKELSKDYKEISMNKKGERNFAYKDHYPDMIPGSHGMVVALVEVETEKGVSEERVKKWKELSGLGAKLIIMIPKDMKRKMTDIIRNTGLMSKVSVGTYEIAINMP